MELPLKDEISAHADLSQEARKFRNVLKSFERNLQLVFGETGIAPHVDHAALATAFATWRTRFDATKHLADINRHDFVIYAAGLMLKELIAAKPLSTLPEKGALPVDKNHPLARWPEGYAYTSFCLSVATAILDEMGSKDVMDERLADDPAFWDSFRENVADSPQNAVAFFDLVCGKEPNWDAPDVPWLRNALRGRNILSAPKSTNQLN
jgi:hypothetical protein